MDGDVDVDDHVFYGTREGESQALCKNNAVLDVKMADAGPLQRLGVLLKHLTLGDTDGHNGIALSPTAARGVSLPRFDTTVMESYLDELSSVKEDVYETFRHRPNLLPATLEGLSKGWALSLSQAFALF